MLTRGWVHLTEFPSHAFLGCRIVVKKKNAGTEFISHEVFLMLFGTSRFPPKSVNLFFILVIVKEKLTNLWGS